MAAELIGRDAELGQLEVLLAGGARVLTLQGPGGVGKTRLALALAARHPPATFCELHACREATEMASTLARSLGMVLRSAEPVEELGGLLCARGACLVILDNLEQLQDDASAALEHWLRQAPQLRLLLTSQRRLGLREERVFFVEPLSLEHGSTLFLQRAAAAGVHLEAAAEVRELVGALDGLPLAIELAAARCRVMSPARILGRLHERFRLLAGRRHGPARHASLQDTLLWTWELLSPLQQDVLGQLTVFCSSFSFDDVEQVLLLPEGEDALELLAELVDFSLVQPAPDLALFSSVRVFARQRLSRADAIRRRHARWVAAALDGSRPEERISVRDGRQRVVDAEAALAWALDQGAPLAADCALVVSEIRYQIGPLAGVADILRRCLALEGVAAEVRLRLWLSLSHSALSEADLPACASALDAASSLAESLGPVSRSCVDHRRAILSWFQGNLDHAQQLCQQGLERLPVDEALGTLRARLLGCLGLVSNQRGQASHARECFHRALRESSSPSEQAILSGNLGLTELDDGQLAAAEVYLQRSIEGARQLGFLTLESAMMGNLALCRVLQEQPGEACELLDAAIAISTSIGDERSLIYQRYALVDIYLIQGRLEEAGELLVFLRQILDRERTVGVHVRALDVEWLARTGDRQAAQQRLPEALERARELETVQLEGLACARFARLIRDGLLEGDYREMLDRAQAISAEVGAGARSSLGYAVARARPRESADLSWVEGRDGRVDLRRRPLLRRLLAPLVGGARAPTGALLEAGWPDSRLPPDRLSSRLYSALHELRRLGIDVESEDGTYRLP